MSHLIACSGISIIFYLLIKNSLREPQVLLKLNNSFEILKIEFARKVLQQTFHN